MKNPITLRWYVVVDDVVGGWAISTVDRPTHAIDPKNGEYELTWGMNSLEAAQHIVNLHNKWIDEAKVKTKP